MKIYLTDISSQCCPEIPVADVDKVVAERIKSRVFNELGLIPRSSGRRIMRIFIIAAAMVSLFVTSALAVSKYFIKHESVGSEEVSGYWTEIGKSGEILEKQEVVFPDAGMLFTFSGPGEWSNVPEFRCFWLPSEPSVGITDEEGWSAYLSDDGNGPDIPYAICCARVSHSGSQFVLNGKVSVVSEEYWDEWYVLKLHSDYSDCKLPWGFEEANYILLFNEQTGFLVTVSGTSDMEALEHIARELEIRDSGRAMPEGEIFYDIGQIDVGRG